MPPRKTKQNGSTRSLEATLWDAANQLRSNMDAAEYKHVVLGLIFLKYVSDVFAKRRATLDAREAQIQSEATMLAATEARVDTKISQLKELQRQIAALLTQRDAAQEKQVAALVKTYSAMKPKDAARIFDSLDDAVLVPVAEEMKSDVMAPLLAAMNPDAAQKLTMKLANKLALPMAAPAASPAPAPALAAEPAADPAPDPAPQAKAAPAAAAKPKG